MADIHDKSTRSYNMSKIKSKDTKPELLVRKFLHANGFRYRLHVKQLPGKPDIVLPKYKTIIFVHGCFWHGHEHCKEAALPKTRTEWWNNKITKNKVSDKINVEKIRSMGWKPIIIWSCTLKTSIIEQQLLKLIKKVTT
jgi:DNA mismatch endonuclease, patch repair protein